MSSSVKITEDMVLRLAMHNTRRDAEQWKWLDPTYKAPHMKVARDQLDAAFADTDVSELLAD